MKPIFFAIAMSLSLTAGAQCDGSVLFEKIVWPNQPFTLLKPYAIPVREIKGAPFSVQYSYLFEKGSMYSFYLKPIGNSTTPINFSLTNSDNELMRVDTLENYQEDGVVLMFTAVTSDAYNLNLHSANSFDGCLIFHVSVHRLVAEQTKDGWKITLPTPSKSSATRKPVEKDTVLRKFEFRSNSTTRSPVELEAGQLYILQIPDEQSAKSLSVHVRSMSDATVNSHIVPQVKGYMYYLRPAEGGIHSFDFLNTSHDKPATALLIMAKERIGLPK